MVLEVLEEAIRGVIQDLLEKKTNGFCAGDLDFCAPEHRAKDLNNSATAIQKAVEAQEFHVHIADFVDCVAVDASMLDFTSSRLFMIICTADATYTCVTCTM